MAPYFEALIFLPKGLRLIFSISKLCHSPCVFISPFRKDRRMVSDLFDKNEFIEVFVDTPIEECERRDPKGMYKKHVKAK